MPELPEVETVKEVLKTQILGKKIENIVVRYNGIIKQDVGLFIKELVGKSFKAITRRGKFLTFELDDLFLVSHLRMEGKYFIKERSLSYEKHEHVIFQFEDGIDLRYHDTRKFGIMVVKRKDDLFTTEPLVGLGYEPFDDALTPDYLLEHFKKLKKTIKEALLDQSIMTGLGNIYVDEVCFSSRLSPMKKASDVTYDEAQLIIDNSRIILKKAIKAGGTTIRSYTSSLGVTGLFQLDLLVHTKAGCPCPLCGGTILKTRVGGRGTYYCQNCQK